MKKFILSILLTLSLAIPAYGEFFKDIVLTSPSGIWTDSRSFATLSAAITALGANERDLYIAREETVVNLTVPSTVRLHFLKSGAIKNSGALVLETTSINADHQIFTGTGTVDFASGTVVKSSWFVDAENAITETSDDTVTLLINRADTISNDCAVGNNVTLRWDTPNLLTVTAGDTVSNVGCVTAPDFQLFAGAGTWSFRDSNTYRLVWFPTLRSAVTWLASTLASLEINTNATVDTSITTPITLHTKISKGTIITIVDTNTLTFNGPFSCGNWQAFTDNNVGLNGVVFGAGSVKEAIVDWWATNTTPGVTDMTDAIAASLNSGAPIIRLLDSTYAYDTTITLVANTAIVGAGNQQTELTYSGNSYGISGSDVSGWKLKDFKLTGTVAALDGIYLRKAQQGFNIEGLWISGFTNPAAGRGIHLFGGIGQGNYFGNFINVTSRDNYVGIRFSSDGSVYYCNAHRLYTCQFISNDSDGIQIDYADGIAFHGCETEDNTGFGINIDHGNSFTYIGGWIENNTAGEMNYTTSSRGAVIFSKVATNDIYYESVAVSAYSSSVSSKMMFLLDSNNASVFKYPWLGYTYDLGGSTYGSRTIERTATTSDGLKTQVAADVVARLNIRADGKHNWSDGTNPADASLERQAADILKVTSALQLPEMTAPAAPGANQVIIYAVDNGAGKTKLMALFPSGAAQQLAIEP